MQQGCDAAKGTTLMMAMEQVGGEEETALPRSLAKTGGRAGDERSRRQGESAQMPQPRSRVGQFEATVKRQRSACGAVRS